MDIFLDSKRIQYGDIYVSINGKHNGDNYIKNALNNGASFIMSENKGKYFVPNLKNNLNKILMNNYKIEKYPKLIGITGTNKKTTLAINLNRKLNEINIKSCVITTIKGIENSYYSTLTTPRNDDLIRIIKDANKNNYEYIIMEVSSIGICEKRVNDLNFEIGIITDLESDHLDYHQNIFSYHQAKIEFACSCKYCLITKDNIYNSIEKILHIKFKDYGIINPPGREEIVSIVPKIIIDYAHTTSSYQYLLEKYSSMKKKNLIVVFGFGGNRDKYKRKEIISLIKKYSDIAIYTNDNPRFENEKKIIYHVINKNDNFINVIFSRKEAINYALNIMSLDDILLIVGKGHEDYQIIKNKKVHFSDKEIVNAYFSRY